MILNSLELICFRNYQRDSIKFNSKNNIICGKNAQGKTNLLEAIYLLCITRSFRTRVDRELVKFDNNYCTLKGEFLTDSGIKKTVIYHYTSEEGKKFSENRKKVERLSNHVGNFPVVLSSPEEYSLTSGPPAERRRFMDILLSQMNNKYIHNLQDYYRILKQRNEILNKREVATNRLKSILEPWNETFIDRGSKIVWERLIFSEKLSHELKNVYSSFILTNERLEFKYKPKVKGNTFEEITGHFRTELQSIQNSEIEQGTSLIGPHRDEFIFLVNGKDLRKFGSRGQHKTALIALTISEFKLIKDKVNETPIILIDDLYSEIDQVREEKIMNHLKDLGQIFITTTLDKMKIEGNETSEKISIFKIEDGKIRDCK